MFVGREKEIAQLETAYSENGFKLFLIYGKKGVGKTTLINEFCRNKSTINFTAKQASSRANLAAFSAVILKYCGDELHPPFMFWDDALNYLAAIPGRPRMILAIDGFDTLIQRDAAFLGVFLRSLEQKLSASNIFMIITSIDDSFMTNSFIKKFTSGILRLDTFLTDENIALLKAQAVRQAGGINRAKFVRVAADRVILREGENNNEMYKIVSGRALCFVNYGTDDEYLLGSLKDGKTFGEYSLLTGKPSIYTVTAYTDMLLMRIARGEFVKFIEINAGNAVGIMQNMAAMMNVMKVNIDMMSNELHSRG